MKSKITCLICIILCLLLSSCAKKLPPSNENGTTEAGTIAVETEKTTTEIPSAFLSTQPDQTQDASESHSEDASSSAGGTNEQVVTPASSSPVVPASSVASSTQTPSSETGEADSIEITFSVRCDNAVKAGNETALAIAPDGAILPAQTLQVEPGMTVFDVTKNSDLVLGYHQSGYGVYVYSINSLGERAAGAMSGWVFLVNGKAVQKSCSACVLQNGDKVEWVYTLDGGRDVMS